MAESNAPVALVTGASAGMGAEIARLLTRKGYRLALTARRAERLEALAAELRASGPDVLVVPASLDDPSAPERLVASTVERFGRLDLLINNAGFGLPELFGDATPESLRSQIEVNLTAPILLTRFALPHLIATRGMIINVGSSITSIPNPVFGVYGMTKAGLAWWNDALRREVRHQGVRVCLVEPGPVDTEFFGAVQGRVDPATDKPGTLFAKIREKPEGPMTAKLDDAARRIVRLIDHPKRRISFLRRAVWPGRLIGGLLQVFPVLGDVVFSAIMRKSDTAPSSNAP